MMNGKSNGVPKVERFIAATLLLLALPMLTVAGLAVIAIGGWPPIFRQQRAGFLGAPFTVVKLRTMRRDVPTPEQLGQVYPGHEGLLPLVGEPLRRLRIDEIPQLLNVARGEMRFIGPRPALLSDSERYNSIENRRLEVPPGLTGWAQTCGNTALSWEDRIALDIYYVDHRSPLLDLRILIRTISTVVRGERADEVSLRKAKEHANRLIGSRGIDQSGS